MQRTFGARVENYGVGGYGTDQGYLRYLGNEQDAAHAVILAHMSENLIRNLTRYRDFHTRSLDWAFKPRFILTQAGDLEFIPLPTLDSQQYRRLVGLESPQLALAHENFHPRADRGRAAPVPRGRLVDPEFRVLGAPRTPSRPLALRTLLRGRPPPGRSR